MDLGVRRGKVKPSPPFTGLGYSDKVRGGRSGVVIGRQ